MIIKVEKEDIGTNDPIENAVRRQYGIECVVDRKYIQFKDNPEFPKRLPLSAQEFVYRYYIGQEVEPFEFEV